MSRQVMKNIHRLIKEAKNDTPIQVSFLADLSAATERLNALESRTPSRSYKPSSMQCTRNMYFGVVGAEQDNERFTSELVGILQSGTDRHEHIQYTLSKMAELGMECEFIDVETYIKSRNLDYLEVVQRKGFETKVKHTTLNISFLCDGVIKYKGHYYLVEIKTETSNKWFERTWVADEHLAQASTYSLCFNIPEVLFIYESRDTTAKKVYLLTVTDEMRADIVSRILFVKQHIEKGTIPPIPADLPKKVCQYCSYRKVCANTI